MKEKTTVYNNVSKNSKLFLLTDQNPVFFSTCFVFIILLFKGIRVSNRSNNSGYECGRTVFHSGLTVYNIPCKFHASYVSLSLYTADTALCVK